MKIFTQSKNRYELNFNDYQIGCKIPINGEIMINTLFKGAINAIKNNVIVCFLVDKNDKIIAIIDQQNVDRWDEKLQILI